MIPKFAMHFLFAFQPPHKGMLATVGGMTWARAALFYGPDRKQGNYIFVYFSCFFLNLFSNTFLSIPYTFLPINQPII